jgi:hypothetical protein
MLRRRRNRMAWLYRRTRVDGLRGLGRIANYVCYWGTGGLLEAFAGILKLSLLTEKFCCSLSIEGYTVLISYTGCSFIGFDAGSNILLSLDVLLDSCRVVVDLMRWDAGDRRTLMGLRCLML